MGKRSGQFECRIECGFYRKTVWLDFVPTVGMQLQLKLRGGDSLSFDVYQVKRVRYNHRKKRFGVKVRAL